MAIRLSAAARRDVTLIYNHLVDANEAFGLDRAEADCRAMQRIDEVIAALHKIAATPYQGTLHDDILPGLRHVTKGRAVFWFRTEGEDLQVLGIFYSGQDHLRHIRARLEG